MFDDSEFQLWGATYRLMLLIWLKDYGSSSHHDERRTPKYLFLNLSMLWLEESRCGYHRVRVRNHSWEVMQVQKHK